MPPGPQVEVHRLPASDAAGLVCVDIRRLVTLAPAHTPLVRQAQDPLVALPGRHAVPVAASGRSILAVHAVLSFLGHRQPHRDLSAQETRRRN